MWAEGPRRDWVVEGGKSGLPPWAAPMTNVFRTMPDPSESRSGPTIELCGHRRLRCRGEEARGRQRKESSRRPSRSAARDHGTCAYRDDRETTSTRGGRSSTYCPSELRVTRTTTGSSRTIQPYRYLINRIPVYPSIGNHDTGEIGRAGRPGPAVRQPLHPGTTAPGLDGRPGVARSGPLLPFRRGSGCGADRARHLEGRDTLRGPNFFLHPNHRQFLDQAFPRTDGKPMWRIPFGHHPPFSAGPQHKNTE